MNLLELLQRQDSVHIRLSVHRDGPLVQTYAKYFPVLVLKSADYGREKNIARKISNFIRNKIQLLRLLKMTWNSDLIFSNTIINGKVLKVLALAGRPVITYVHELENVIDLYLRYGDAGYSLKHSSLLAYPSLKVRNTLVEKYNVDQHRLMPLNYYFPVDRQLLGQQIMRDLAIQSFRNRFGFSAGDFIVGGMGLASARKGTDLFIEVYHAVRRKNAEIRFCWIGDFETETIREELLQKLSQGNPDNFVFTGVLPHSYFNLSPFEIFFLSSREDPYPLVILEAAMMKIPAICFADSGGIPEFVDNDAGWTIPGFDVNFVCDLLIDLYKNRSAIAAKGSVAYNKVMDRHTDASHILQQFNDLVKGIQR
jgi:glycosyltransferase involved in cell wall biosynthesis